MAGYNETKSGAMHKTVPQSPYSLEYSRNEDACGRMDCSAECPEKQSNLLETDS